VLETPSSTGFCSRLVAGIFPILERFIEEFLDVASLRLIGGALKHLTKMLYVFASDEPFHGLSSHDRPHRKHAAELCRVQDISDIGATADN